MITLLMVAAYIIAAPLGFAYIKNEDTAKKYYIASVCMVFTLLTGFRSLDVGADTQNYMASYYNIAQTRWDELFLTFIRYTRSSGGMLFNNALRDPGYAIFVKLTQIISTDYRFYMFVMGLLVNIPLAIFTYRNSTTPWISLLVYFVLSFSFYGTTGYRQTIAFVLSNLIGYEFIKQRKLIPFLLVITVGFFIHKSILVTIPLFFLANKKITPPYVICILTGIVTVFVFRVPFSVLMKQLSGYGEMYTGQYEGAGTWTFTFMLLLALLVSLIYQRNLINRNRHANHYINALILAAVFDPLTFVNPSAMRIVEYFSFYLMLLIPCFITIVERRSRIIANVLITALLLGLLVKSGQTYHFMW